MRERGVPRAAVVYETVRESGEFELKRSAPSLMWSGLAAGLSMGFSFLVQASLRHHLPDASWRPLVTGFGYSAGFLIVILGRQQLFTENTLTVVLPLLVNRKLQVLVSVLRLWTIVLAANLVGASIFALALAHAPVLDAAMRPSLFAIGDHLLDAAPSTTFVQAIFAGWLIALMVWLLPAAEAARIWIIVFLTYFIALGGFPHVIAGSVDTLYVVFAGARAWTDYVVDWLFPTLLGNIVGGVSLVAVLSHVQVAEPTTPPQEQAPEKNAHRETRMVT